MEKGVLLCVDDEIIVLTALKDQLRRRFGSEFHIDVAEAPRRHWSCSRSWRWMATPSGDRVGLAHAGHERRRVLIQAHGRFPSVVRSCCQARPAAAVDRARREAGLHDFLSKPWNAEALVSRSNQGLQERPPSRDGWGAPGATPAAWAWCEAGNQPVFSTPLSWRAREVSSLQLATAAAGACAEKRARYSEGATPS